MKLQLKNTTLLAAFLANPTKNTPRLKYAAMLEDNGGKERAEFIRLQSDLHRADQHDPTFKAKRDREEALLSEHGKQWEAEVFEAAVGGFEPGVNEVGFIATRPELRLNLMGCSICSEVQTKLLEQFPGRVSVNDGPVVFHDSGRGDWQRRLVRATVS